MKSPTTQLGVRKNPDSSRVHGLCLTASSSKSEVRARPPRQRDAETPDPLVSGQEATLEQETGRQENVGIGENERGGRCFLNVQDVAILLQVPVSWVYDRMRKRSSERLPAYKLGKYWRFSEDEVLAWVKRQRGGQRVA